MIEQMLLIIRVAGVSSSLSDSALMAEERTWNGNSLDPLASNDWGTEEGEEGREKLFVSLF